MLFLSPLGCLPSTSKATIGSAPVRACSVAATAPRQSRRGVQFTSRYPQTVYAGSPSTLPRSLSSSTSRLSGPSPTSSAIPLPPSLRARIDSYLQNHKGKAPEANLPDDQHSFTARVIAIRKHSKVTFLSVTDGSSSSSTLLQVVLTADAHDAVDRELKEKGRPPLGVADTVQLTGSFAVRSRQQGAATTSTGIEYKAEQCQVLGSSDREVSGQDAGHDPCTRVRY